MREPSLASTLVAWAGALTSSWAGIRSKKEMELLTVVPATATAGISSPASSTPHITPASTNATSRRRTVIAG